MIDGLYIKRKRRTADWPRWSARARPRSLVSQTLGAREVRAEPNGCELSTSAVAVGPKWHPNGYGRSSARGRRRGSADLVSQCACFASVQPRPPVRPSVRARGPPTGARARPLAAGPRGAHVPNVICHRDDRTARPARSQPTVAQVALKRALGALVHLARAPPPPTPPTHPGALRAGRAAPAAVPQCVRGPQSPVG